MVRRLKTEHGKVRSLHGVHHVGHPDLGGIASQPASPAGASERLHQAGLVKVSELLLEETKWDALGRGDFSGGDGTPTLAKSQVDHGTECVLRLLRYPEHQSPSDPCHKLYLPGRIHFHHIECCPHVEGMDRVNVRIVDPRQPRLGQAVTGAALLVGFVLDWPPAIPVIGIILAAASVFGPRANLYGYLFRALPLGPPRELEEAAPPRFANTLGFIVLALATITHYVFDATTVAWSLG